MKMATRLTWMIATGCLIAGAATAETSETPPPDVCIEDGGFLVDFGIGDFEDAEVGAVPAGRDQCGSTDEASPGDADVPTLTCGSPCGPIETEADECVAILDFVVCNAAACIVNAAAYEGNVTGEVCSAD